MGRYARAEVGDLYRVPAYSWFDIDMSSCRSLVESGDDLLRVPLAIRTVLPALVAGRPAWEQQG